jgi:hypothetical protein
MKNGAPRQDPTAMERSMFARINEDNGHKAAKAFHDLPVKYGCFLPSKCGPAEGANS